MFFRLKVIKLHEYLIYISKVKIFGTNKFTAKNYLNKYSLICKKLIFFIPNFYKNNEKHYLIHNYSYKIYKQFRRNFDSICHGNKTRLSNNFSIKIGL